MSDRFDVAVQIEVERQLKERAKDPHYMVQVYRRYADDLEQQLEEMRPLAEFAEAVLESDSDMEMSEAAKIIGVRGVGQNNLFRLLREKRVLITGRGRRDQQHNQPYQKYIDLGWFRRVEQTWVNPRSSERMVSYKTVVTQKGLRAIRRLLEAA